MSAYPRLIVDLEKIEHNSRLITNLAKRHGISICGVTKACCGDPEVALAMLRGGVVSVADSRVKNLQRLYDAGIESELILLRTPMLSEAPSVITYANISLNSELTVIRRLAQVAERKGLRHRLILMVETGDLREGINIDDIESTIECILKLEGVILEGIGNNLACYAGVIPTQEKTEQFSALVEDIENRIGLCFPIVSGGNSAHLPLLLEDKPMGRINQLRIGEGILIGRETVRRSPIPGAYQDAFTLEGEAIECNTKPSVPDGLVSQNAFGEHPVFQNVGPQRRAILALGRQDVVIEDLTPNAPGISVLGGSSDHLILDIGDAGLRVGDVMRFRLNYAALLRAYTCPYVNKVYVKRGNLLPKDFFQEPIFTSA